MLKVELLHFTKTLEEYVGKENGSWKGGLIWKINNKITPK